jgi:hypothetical protein
MDIRLSYEGDSVNGFSRAKSLRCLTIAAVDIQRPWFLARCGLVRRSVRRASSGVTLNAPELGSLGGSEVPLGCFFLLETRLSLEEAFGSIQPMEPWRFSLGLELAY